MAAVGEPVRGHAEPVPEREAGERLAVLPDRHANAVRLAGALGNQAFGRLLRASATLARADDGAFTDDPRTADVSGGDTVSDKPGPVRSTLVTRLQTREGYTFKGSPDPGAWAQGFLSFFGFRPERGMTGGRPRYWFNDAVRDLTFILDKMVEQATLDNADLSREKALAVATSLLPPGPPGPSPTRTALYVSFSISEAVHAPPGKPGSTGTPDPVGEQVGIQYTLELHPENKSGVEVSWVAQMGWAKDAGGESKLKVQNLLSGVQAAYVFAFLEGSLQVTPIANALAGYVRGEGKKDQIMRLMPATQVGGGAQIAYVVPGTGGHLQIGGQAAASWTDPSDANSTIDYGGQIFLQWKF